MRYEGSAIRKYISLIFIALLSIGSSACSMKQTLPTPTLSTAPATPTLPIDQELRISNVGSEAIDNLTVVLPSNDPFRPTRIAFGNVGVGEVTAYHSITSGVYRYAAYEYTREGHTIYQSVTDWVGEQPLPGKQFTYEISLDTTRVQGEQIQLIAVHTDTP